MGCRPVFSGLITIRQRAVPFNITVVQVYAPTSDYDDNEVENSMTSYGVSLIRNRRRTFLLCKETGIQKWARMLYENWQGICGPFCNDETKERGLRLLEFATFNKDLVLANTFGHHKASRRWTWHSPSGQHHEQIDYILVRKHIQTGVNIARTPSFPGADDLLLMTFHLRLKSQQVTRLKFDLEKLKDPNVLETIPAMTG